MKLTASMKRLLWKMDYIRYLYGPVENPAEKARGTSWKSLRAWWHWLWWKAGFGRYAKPFVLRCEFPPGPHPPEAYRT